VICPHCFADLRREQRYWSQVLEMPRGVRVGAEGEPNSLHLHDLRVRRLAAMLADPLQPGAPPLRCTPDQLRLAASRKILTDPSSSSGGGCAPTSAEILTRS
jgi:hypothetical protein